MAAKNKKKEIEMKMTKYVCAYESGGGIMKISENRKMAYSSMAYQ